MPSDLPKPPIITGCPAMDPHTLAWGPGVRGMKHLLAFDFLAAGSLGGVVIEQVLQVPQDAIVLLDVWVQRGSLADEVNRPHISGEELLVLVSHHLQWNMRCDSQDAAGREASALLVRIFVALSGPPHFKGLGVVALLDTKTPLTPKLPSAALDHCPAGNQELLKHPTPKTRTAAERRSVR